jgi:hypothetical protein
VHVPEEFVIVTRPVDVFTEHAVDEPAEYVMVPLPELVAVTVNVSP